MSKDLFGNEGCSCSAASAPDLFWVGGSLWYLFFVSFSGEKWIASRLSTSAFTVDFPSFPPCFDRNWDSRRRLIESGLDGAALSTKAVKFSHVLISGFWKRKRFTSSASAGRLAKRDRETLASLRT